MMATPADAGGTRLRRIYDRTRLSAVPMLPRNGCVTFRLPEWFQTTSRLRQRPLGSISGENRGPQAGAGVIPALSVPAGTLRMLRRMAIMLTAVGLVFAAVFGFEAFRARMIQKAIAGLRNPPQTVSRITASTQQWQDRLE